MNRHVFFHIGDVHLQAGHPRNGDRLAALDQILARAAATPELAAILIPGDLFHQKSTAEDRNALAPRLQAFANCAPVVLCYGNHDQPGDLDIFAKLEAAWPIYVSDRPQVLRFALREQGQSSFLAATGEETFAACFVLPYPHKGGCVGAGVEHGELGAAARASLEPIFIAAGAELLEADANRHTIPLAMIHVNIGGSLSSTGQPQIGREIELDAALLAHLNGCYIAANHIHRHQAIHGAVYAGSIARMDFGENEPKGYVEVVYNDTTFDWRFVELDVPRQVQVEGMLTRAAFTITEIDGDVVDGARTERDWRGADVRVRYHYKKAEIGVLDVAKIHAEMAGCRSLKLDPVPALERDVRAPQVVAAKTLDEKVIAYCDLNGIAVGTRLIDKLGALQASTAEAVLQDAQTRAALIGTTEPAEQTQAVA